ncbi:hypothetical protein LIER_23230 [Lithospermum erythrorhizon]|uniref:Peptidase S1 domain-containing protein n=1 Tax=Lithospermum erythrorhizon TaxID=34254 RepID=A0AAV3QWM6_LITER
MASFFTPHGDSGTSLHIGTRNSRDITILPIHTSPYKGICIDWDFVPDSMDWSPYASGSCYCLTSRGNLDSEAPLRYLKDEVAAGGAVWTGSI